MPTSFRKYYIYGTLSGLLWALNGIVFGFSLEGNYLFLTPLVLAFFNDFVSFIYMLINSVRRYGLRNFFNLFKNKNHLKIFFSALFGGPLGMTFYVFAIKYCGIGYATALSATYPVFGSIFAHLFLEDKLTLISFLGVLLAVLGSFFLVYSSDSNYPNFWWGILSAILCAVCWGTEVVVSSHVMSFDLAPDQAYLLRQFFSSLGYIIIMLVIFIGNENIMNYFQTIHFQWMPVLALFGTLSYVFYYRAINGIGPIKAMGLNITYSVWGVVLGSILLKEAISLKLILMCLVIILGSYLTSFKVKSN